MSSESFGNSLGSAVEFGGAHTHPGVGWLSAWGYWGNEAQFQGPGILQQTTPDMFSW